MVRPPPPASSHARRDRRFDQVLQLRQRFPRQVPPKAWLPPPEKLLKLIR